MFHLHRNAIPISGGGIQEENRALQRQAVRLLGAESQCNSEFGTMVYRILTSTYTDRVETLLFDSEAESLSTASSLTVGYRPSWITPHPENPSIWFTGLEQEDGRVVAIEYDDEGKGKIVGERSSEGAEPCTLVAHKGELLIGNVSFSSRDYNIVPVFTAFDRHITRGSTRCVVCRRKRCCASVKFLATLCCVVHDEPLAQRFQFKRGSTAFVSPSSGGPASDPR